MVGRDPSSRRRTDLPLPLHELSGHICRASIEGFAVVLDSGLALPSISSDLATGGGLTGNFVENELVGRDPSKRRRTDLPLPLYELSGHICRASCEGFAVVLDSGFALSSISSDLSPCGR